MLFCTDFKILKGFPVATMLQKLHRDKYHLLQAFNELQIFPLINAVFLQKQTGDIYVDDAEKITSVFVIHKSGFALLILSDGYSDFAAIADFIKSNKGLPNYFHIYAPPEKFIDYLNTQSEIGIRIRRRIKLQYQGSTIDNKVQLPGKFNCYQINEENFDRLSSFNLSLEDKFWDSKEHFLREGYGYYIEDADKKPAAVCYSACVADNVSEIDIFTEDSYRKMGLGKFVTAYFVKGSIERGITANWDCFVENTASFTVAKNMGFEPVKEYTFLSVYFEK